MIGNEAQLDELLSRPYEGDNLNGDLLILGAGGKMGPTLALRARRAAEKTRVIAVARFTSESAAHQLERAGIEIIRADLLEPGALARLPDAPNVIFMAAMKFGTTGAEHLTWAMNTFLPGLVAERFRKSRIVAFSTGNVYPLVPVRGGGATEDTTAAPVGEYAQSALGRERMFEYGSHKYGTPVATLRLNYAVEMRYGVLVDIGRKVFAREPVDVTMGFVNVIWQGDANSVCLRSFGRCSSPPYILNLAGVETLSVRDLASEFGKRFGIEPAIRGQEADTALLSNSGRMVADFGKPHVSVAEMIDWIAAWIQSGGASHGKPTHFETRDGRF
jgi:nucleoside-diphosphate-sugar epimerase